MKFFAPIMRYRKCLENIGTNLGTQGRNLATQGPNFSTNGPCLGNQGPNLGQNVRQLTYLYYNRYLS